MASLASAEKKSAKKIYFYDDAEENRPHPRYNNDIEFVSTYRR